MGSAGIKISAGSYDSRNAPDYAYVYNSEWPSLACVFDTVVTVGAAPLFGTVNLTVPHNLGFYPLTIAWLMVNGVCKGRIYSFSSYQTYPLPQSVVNVTFDKTNIYLANQEPYAVQICIKCYNTDITKAVNYTNPRPAPAKLPYDPHYGIKVVKHGQDINSPDLRNFILHSRAQSPALLAVVPGVGLNGGIGGAYYNNPVGYVPWTFGFVNSSGTTYGPMAPGFDPIQSNVLSLGLSLPFQPSSGPALTVNGATIQTFNVNPTPVSLVVLRDPLVATTIVNASY